MPSPMRKALIVYFSPAGTTRRIARVIENVLKAQGTPVVMIDLGRDDDAPFILTQMLDARDNICVYAGSPVYATFSTPPVMEFIARLPVSRSGFSVPFVTWGGVYSGRALYDMGRALSQKGYPVLGAGKFLAEHSLMWMLDRPFGKGHPDSEDDTLAKKLTEAVEAKLRSAEPQPIALGRLSPDGSSSVPSPDPEGFTRNKRHYPPRTVDRESCTRCGLCLEQCPVQAIRMNPYPEFGDDCVFCLNCVRYCPEAAIHVDLTPLFTRIEERRAQIREPEGSALHL